MDGAESGGGPETQDDGMRECIAALNNINCHADSVEMLKYEAIVVCSVLRDTDHSCAEAEAGEKAEEVFHVDVVSVLEESFEAAGLKVQILEGMDNKAFIKVAAAEMVIGRAAEDLQLKKLTTLGLQTVFDWELRDSFMRQPYDDVLFSWTERYYCLHYIIHSLDASWP